MKLVLALLVLAVIATRAAAITCPSSLFTTNDLNMCGAVVNYPPPTAGVFLGCNPSAGSFFPVGTTTVGCSELNPSPPPFANSCEFTVTVADSQAPGMGCPDDVLTGTEEDTCGATVEFQPTASDNCPGVTMAIESGLQSGSLFPGGTTMVTLRSTDAAGNTSFPCSFLVKVADTVSPRIACPADIVVPAPGTVEYAVMADDACTAMVEVTFSVPSGSVFRAPRTTVGATARDTAGNESSCTFDVVVAPSPTSTTVPPPQGCPVEPTLTSVGCRLTVLAPNVAVAASEPARARLGRLLDRITDLVVTAQGHEAAGKRRPLRAAIRKSINRLGRFQKKVLAKKSGVVEPARTAITEEVERLREDLRAVLG